MNMFKSYKVYLNVLLWRLGCRSVLPRDWIARVNVRETGERLVDISNDTRLRFIPELEKPILLRQQVYDLLIRASLSLPNGYFIKVHDAYRSIQQQKASWEKRYAELAALHPGMDDSELQRLTRLRIASPLTNGYGGHQTGAAVDVTLCSRDGQDLELGTSIPEHNKKTATRSVDLTPEERLNRKVLVDAMLSAGFVNYPVEWWHYSYGDRLWAAYSNRKTCHYGPIEIQ